MAQLPVPRQPLPFSPLAGSAGALHLQPGRDVCFATLSGMLQGLPFGGLCGRAWLAAAQVQAAGAEVQRCLAPYLEYPCLERILMTFANDPEQASPTPLAPPPPPPPPPGPHTHTHLCAA